MVDMHSHILYGLDDGPCNLDMALDMALVAAESHVQKIVATSHGNLYSFKLEDYNRTLMEFQEKLDYYKIPIKMYPGMEWLITPYLMKSKDIDHLLTMNETRYILIEFLFHEDIEFVFEAILQLKNKGYWVILAHPERYLFLQKYPENIYELVCDGCGMQVNKDSILGAFGDAARELAIDMLDANLVHFVASDAHGIHRRNPDLRRIQRWIWKYFSPSHAELFFEQNPENMLNDKLFSGFHPAMIRQKQYTRR